MEAVAEIETDQQVPQDPPVKKLAEDHRVKLDSIVQRMVRNKEADDDIQMVVNDFRDKYGVAEQKEEPVVIEQPVPKPELSTTKLNAWEFPTVAPITPEQIEEVKSRRADKVFKADETLMNAWKDSDEVTRDMLLHKMDMDEMNSAQQPMAIDNAAPNQPFIPQALREADRKQKRESIPSEEIARVKDDPATHRTIIAKTAIKYKSEGKKKEADELAAATYIKDAEDRHSPIVDKNAKEIEEGKLVYNIERQEIYKPSSLGESIAHGFEQRTKAYHEGYKLAIMPRDEQIKFLEHEINVEYDPDKPIPVPGTVGEMIGSEGIATFRSVGASLVTGFLTKNPALASTVGAAASADEYAMRSYFNEKVRTYSQVKRKLVSEGMDEHEAQQIALDKSEQNARLAATGDTIAAALMTASGLRSGARPLNLAFNKSVINNAKQIIGGGLKFAAHSTKEGLAPALIASAVQAGKNIASNEIGVKRDADEGVLEAGATMLAFHGVVAATSKALSIGASGAKSLVRALAKKPIDVTTKVAADLLEDHTIAPEDAEVLLNEVKSQQAFESQFPNVKSDVDIARLQELTSEFDANKAKLAKPEEGGVHETIQKSIKERQKGIEWEVEMLQAAPEDQAKILKAKQNELQTELDAHDAAKAEGKAGKLEDRAAVKKQVTAIEKKLDEVQTRLDSPLHEAEKLLNEQIEKGELKGMLADIARENPEEVLKFVAEQAQGEVEMDGVMKSSREETVQQFGEKIVKMAEEMFPKPKPRHTVSQAGVRNIKMKEQPPVKMGFEDFQKGIIEQAAVVNDSEGSPEPTKPAAAEPVAKPDADSGEQRTTGIKNAVTKEERELRGLSEVEVEMRRSFPKVFDAGKAKVDNGEINPRLLAKELMTKPRALNAEESVALIYDRMRLQNDHKKVMTDIEAARTEGNDAKADVLESHMNEIESEININDEAARRTGYEQGLGLAARKMMIKEDYSLANQVQRYKTANDGKDIPNEVRAKLEEQTKKLDNALAKLEEYEKRISELEAQKNINKEKGTNSSKKAKGDFKKEREDIFKNIKNKWTKASNDNTLTAVPFPYAKQFAAITPEVAKLIKSYAEQGVTELKEIVKDLHQQFTANISPDITEKDVVDLLAGVYKEKKKPTLDRNKMKFQADVEKIKYQIDSEKERIRLSNRSKGQVYVDWFQKWRRAALLSGVKVMGKIGAAAAMRSGVISPVESVIGGVLRKVPGISRIAKGAPREGAGFNAKAEAKALTQWVDKMTYKDIGEIMRGGKGELEYLYSDKIYPPSDFLDFFGQLHASIKTLPKRGEFFRSFELRARHAAKEGRDIGDPLIQQEIALGAYNDGLRAIFMQENWVTNSYKSVIRSMESSKIGGGKMAAEVMRFMFPIVKVPTNFVAESTSYMVGGLKAAFALRHGISKMTPEQKDYVMRNFKKQTIGAAFILIGYFNPDAIGGYYMGKRRDDDLQAGDLLMFGHQIPHWMAHTPLLEALQFGATLRRMKDREESKGKDANILTGLPTAMKGITYQIPFLNTSGQISNASSSVDGMKMYLFRMGQGVIEPQLVKEIAQWKDTDNDGEEIKRDPETFLDQLKTGIPGLRGNVKERKQNGGSSGGAGASGSYKRPKKPSIHRPKKHG